MKKWVKGRRMSCEQAMIEFGTLLRDADDAKKRDEETEPYLLSALQAIKSRPECREEFIAVFRGLLDGGTRGPWEVLPFCMHELRWPEVKSLVDERLDTAVKANDWRIINMLASYRDSFTDEWDDWVLFDYYSVRVGRARPD